MVGIYRISHFWERRSASLSSVTQDVHERHGEDPFPVRIAFDVPDLQEEGGVNGFVSSE